MKGMSSMLILALSLCFLGVSFADAEFPKEEDLKENADEGIKNAEGQQVYVISGSDLDVAASGYGINYQDFDKSHKHGYHNNLDHKGSKGYHDDKHYHGNHHGDHGNHKQIGYHDKGGKDYKGYEDKKHHYGDHFHGDKGSKGFHHGSKGHANKGHKNSGFKNLYHKEEYGINKKFYDDDDFKKYHDVHDDFDAFYKGHKGGAIKGAAYTGGKSHNIYGNKGSFGKGNQYDNKGGSKGVLGKSKHHDHHSLYGNDGGHYGSFGHGHHGHGNHGTGGYGIGGHAHNGYSHGGHKLGGHGYGGNGLSGYGAGGHRLAGSGHGGYLHAGPHRGHGEYDTGYEQPYMSSIHTHDGHGQNHGGYGYGHSPYGKGSATSYSHFNIKHKPY